MIVDFFIVIYYDYILYNSQLQVLKGNLRFLYSPSNDIREEALCRLIWLLGKEKDSVQKLPRLSSLHGLPLSSLCIFEPKNFIKRSEGNYQVTYLHSEYLKICYNLDLIT